jgi:hypothetical protein
MYATVPEKSAQSEKIIWKSRVLPDDNIRKLLAFAFLSPISDLQDSRFANLVHCKTSNAALIGQVPHQFKPTVVRESPEARSKSARPTLVLPPTLRRLRQSHASQQATPQ